MRTHPVGLAGVAALVVTLLPGPATAATRVDGTHFADAGVRTVSQGCLDPGARPEATPRPTFSRTADAPLGRRVAGWTPAEHSFGVGPSLHVTSPSTLRKLRVALRAPGGTASGQAVVAYSAAGDAGLWRGRGFVSPQVSNGWQWVDADDLVLQWRHYDAAGAADQDASNATLQAFVGAHGGDGQGAWVGFAFGCDGNAFEVDALQVVTDAESRTLDFEGFGSRATITQGTRKAKRVTLVAGESRTLTARLRTLTGEGLPGRLTIQRREPGKAFRTHLRRKVGRSGATSFRVAPVRAQAYRVVYPGSGAYDGDTSAVLQVQVRSNVRARLAKGTVTRGRAFTVSGRFYPGRTARVSLQRYAGGDWTTVRTGRSARDGRYRISMASHRLGKSYWRVRVAAGGGNVEGRSPWLRLRTVAPPSGGGGGGGGGGGTPSDPTPPPPVDPPPPPPGPQRTGA